MNRFGRIIRRVVPGVAATVVVGAILWTVFPTSTFLSQRRALDVAEERLAVLDAENARLAQRVDLLQTDAEIERMAREQYNLVRDGEEAYALLPPRLGDIDLTVLRVVLEAAVFGGASR